MVCIAPALVGAYDGLLWVDFGSWQPAAVEPIRPLAEAGGQESVVHPT